MKIVTKRDSKYTWIALKDNKGVYQCWFDNNIRSKDMVLAGNLYLSNGSQLNNIKQLLKKEGNI